MRDALNVFIGAVVAGLAGYFIGMMSSGTVNFAEWPEQTRDIVSMSPVFGALIGYFFF